MPNLSSALGTTQPYIPAINPTQLGKFAGLHMHFGTLVALNAAITNERTNMAGSGGLWTDGQTFTISGEPPSIKRIWTTTNSGHARTVLLKSGITVLLAFDSSIVTETNQLPINGYGNDGDVAIHWAAGIAYQKNAGAWEIAHQNLTPQIIEDNLTSDVPEHALSAAQGVVLNEALSTKVNQTDFDLLQTQVSPSLAQVRLGTDQTLLTSTWEQLELSSIQFDTNNFFSGSEFTPSTAGFYRLTGIAELSDVSTYARLAVYIDGNSERLGMPSTPFETTNAVVSLDEIIYADGTNAISVWALSDSNAIILGTSRFTLEFLYQSDDPTVGSFQAVGLFRLAASSFAPSGNFTHTHVPPPLNALSIVDEFVGDGLLAGRNAVATTGASPWYDTVGYSTSGGKLQLTGNIDPNAPTLTIDNIEFYMPDGCFIETQFDAPTDQSVLAFATNIGSTNVSVYCNVLVDSNICTRIDAIGLNGFVDSNDNLLPNDSSDPNWPYSQSFSLDEYVSEPVDARNKLIRVELSPSVFNLYVDGILMLSQQPRWDVQFFAADPSRDPLGSTHCDITLFKSNLDDLVTVDFVRMGAL